MQTYPVAYIDITALKHNLNKVKGFAPDSKVMSVIKANAYGHGDIRVAIALEESDAFAVARLSEGINLRQAGIKKNIVLLEGVHDIKQLQLAAENSLSPVFHNQVQIDLLSGAELIRPLQFCWLMIETGMHRLGISTDSFPAAITTLRNSNKINGEIRVMTHFANADKPNDCRNKLQMDNLLESKQVENVITAMANSAAIISLPGSHQQWIRPGVMLYGSSPFPDKTADDLGLKPVMKLAAQLISIEQLQAGEQVGYGGAWQARKEMKVGTVNIGYGDGYSRQLSNKGKVWIHNQLVDVLGRVSMDMICIDLSSTSNVKIGDEVILWGIKELQIDFIATYANSISYELLCQVNNRVVRQYHG